MNCKPFAFTKVEKLKDVTNANHIGCEILYFVDINFDALTGLWSKTVFQKASIINGLLPLNHSLQIQPINVGCWFPEIQCNKGNIP